MKLLLVASILRISLGQDSCTGSTSNGNYDLNPLTATSDYHVENNGRTYYLNVCRGVVEEVRSPKGIEKEQDIGARYRFEDGDHSIGQFNTTLAFEGTNPVLVYSEGSPCSPDEKLRASSAIRFICDTKISGSGQPSLIAYLPPASDTPCAYFFEWRTKHACPVARSVSALSIIFGLVITLCLGYLIIGTIYRRFVLQHRGFEMLPRLSFCGLSDLCRRLPETLQRTRSRFPNRSSATWNNRSWGRDGLHYEALSAEDEREPLHDDRRFSIDEDLETEYQRREQTTAGFSNSQVFGSNDHTVVGASNTRRLGIDSEGVIRL